MTAAELIALLQTIPSDTKIFVWDTATGERLEIGELDPLADSNGVMIADITTVSN